MQMSFDELAREILARPCAHRVSLIAVDGGAGAGKSTFGAREDLAFQIRDWVGDVRGRGLLAERKHLPFAPVVVLEGVTSSRRALSTRLTFAIWIEAPAPLRMARGLERDADVPENRELWDGWLPMETALLAADGARARADLVVDGTRPAGDGIHVLEKRLLTPRPR